MKKNTHIIEYIYFKLNILFELTIFKEYCSCSDIVNAEILGQCCK